MPQLQNKILIAGFIGLAVLSWLMNSKTPEAQEPEKAVTADTMIPPGFVLVPIEISNIAAVAALIDQFGVIDLYGGNSEANAVQIASRVKVLRAPLNPRQYAVMVSESLSKEIMTFKGPFWAVVQNRLAAAAPEKPRLPVASAPAEIEYYREDHP